MMYGPIVDRPLPPIVDRPLTARGTLAAVQVLLRCNWCAVVRPHPFQVIATPMNTALLLARLFVGLSLAAHGSQKLFGWFGGYGLAGTGGFFDSLGFRPGRLSALAAGLGEFGGGVLLAAGFLSPIGSGLIIVVMVVAALAVHLKHGFFVTNNGVEMPLSYAASAFILAFTGPGRFSLDARLGTAVLTNARHIWIVVAVAVVLAILILLLRRPVPGPPAP